MRLLLLSAVASTLVLLSGCSTPPEARLESPSMRVTGLDSTASSAVLSLSFSNPNTAPLAAIKVRHTLYLGDDRIGRFDDPRPIGIPPLGTVAHDITLTAALTKEIQAYLTKASADTRASVETTLEVATVEDSTTTLKCFGSGPIQRTNH